MKPIDFTQYPKVLPYVENLIGKSYFKPFEYSILDEESFISIVEGWIDEYEKNIDVIIKNTLLVYSLTNEQTGHQALKEDWIKWSPYHKEPRLTEHIVRQWWRDNFIACISHLYQNMVHEKGKEIRGGASGCLITCSFVVRFVESELKRVKLIAVSDFSMSLNITNSLHSEIDIYN